MSKPLCKQTVFFFLKEMIKKVLGTTTSFFVGNNTFTIGRRKYYQTRAVIREYSKKSGFAGLRWLAPTRTPFQ